MPELGQIVSVSFPESAWVGQPMIQSAILKNIGDVGGTIYYRLSKPLSQTGFIQSIVIEANEEIEVPIINYETGKPWVMADSGESTRDYILAVWTGSPSFPGVGSLDDSFTWEIIRISATGTILSVSPPPEANEGSIVTIPIQWERCGENTEGLGVELALKLIDISNGQILDEVNQTVLPENCNSTSTTSFFFTMPNTDFGILVLLVLENIYNPEKDAIDNVIVDFTDFIILLSEEPLFPTASISIFNYPMLPIPQGSEYTILMSWVNFSQFSGLIFARLSNLDTGEEMFFFVSDLMTNTGQETEETFIAPDTNLNLRFEVGHIEQDTIEVVDEFIEVTIETFPAGTISINTFPVSGFVFVDGAGLGQAPQEALVSIGPHTVSFGPVQGFITPDPIQVEVVQGETVSVTGEYIESEGTDLVPIALGGLGLLAAIILLTRKKGK